MKKSITTMLMILFIATIARADGPICGSVEAFNRTHRWQDLPGCTEKRDYSNQTSAMTLLGRAKDAFKEFFEAWDSGEIDDAINESGGCEEYMNGANEEWSSDPELVRARPAYEEMKRKVAQYMGWAQMMKDIIHKYHYAKTWIDEANKGAEGAPATAMIYAKDLQGIMREAAAEGIPETFLIPGSGDTKPATIAEIRTMIAPLLGEATAAIVKEKEEDDRKWSPFTSKLGGDRLKFFNESYRIGTNVYGTGGKYLDTPEEFRAAPLMCTISYNESGVIPQWRLKCYRFNGDKQIGGVRVSTGWGSSVPNSAFR